MITLQKIGDAIKFTFSGNTHYLQDGTVEVPVNSLSLTIDDSGMATFRKSASNDIFISATYGELGMTKEELVAWYKENMVDGGGSDITSGDVQNMIDESISGKADSSAVTEEISAAVSGKQDTLIAGENITISGNVISAEGDSITIDPSLDSGSTNPVANSAITNTLYTAANANGDGNGYVGNIEAKDDSTYLDRLLWGFNATRYKRPLGGSDSNNTQGVSFYCSSINGVRTVSNKYQNVGHFNLVETSAITTSVTSASTDAQVPSAKAVYDALQEGGGNNVVELTQTEYDALVSGGTVDPTAFYIITDAVAFDPSTKVDTSAFTAYSAATDTALSGKADTSAVTESINAAVSGKVDTSTFNTYSGSVDTALSGKQDTLSAGTGIEISGNVISATGGGSTYTAGEGIIITGSSNAITLDANIYKGNGIASVSVNNPSGSGNGYNKISGMTSFGAGWMVATNNIDEAAFGYFNKSNGSSQQFIHSSGNTLFSVGNGTANNARHNAFEIRQNGDIYLTKDGQNVKLQDQLGGGEVSSAITSGDTNAVAGGAVYDKFDEVEQVTAVALNALNDKFGGLSLVKLTQSEYNALSPNYDNNTLYVIVN